MARHTKIGKASPAAGYKVAPTGTAEELATLGRDLKQGVEISASQANTVDVVVGFSANLTTTSGYLLAPGQSVFVPVDKESDVWVISGSASQNVGWVSY